MFKVWLKHSQDVYIIFVFSYSHVAYNCSNSLNKKLNILIIKGEKYQLDLSKLLMSWSDCFLSQSKYFDQLSHRKTKQDQKQEKLCQSTWKISKNRGILKHIWWEVIREKLMFRMLWNTLKDGIHYLRNESVSMKVFLLNMHEAMDFIWSGQSYTSFNLCILNFFYENYWSRLPSSSKCRRSVHHGNIKFWFSGNANTGRHCLLLQFHLSY